MPPPFAEDSLIPEPSGAQWNPERPEYRAFTRFALLTRECRELEKRVKELKKELEDLGYQLRDYLGAGGYERVRVEGFTIFLRRELYVRAKEGIRSEEVCRALKETGMGHFVSEQYSVMSLSSHLRELERMHAEELASGEIASTSELLPVEVARVLNCEPKYSVVARET